MLFYIAQIQIYIRFSIIIAVSLLTPLSQFSLLHDVELYVYYYLAHILLCCYCRLLSLSNHNNHFLQLSIFSHIIFVPCYYKNVFYLCRFNIVKLQHYLKSIHLGVKYFILILFLTDSAFCLYQKTRKLKTT